MAQTKQAEALNKAKEMLDGWLAAEQAVMTGQEYRMGSKSLRRADLSMIAERVRYWDDKVKALEGNSRIRTQQIVPRDA